MQIIEMKIELRPKCDEDQRTVDRLCRAFVENKPLPLALAGHEMYVVIVSGVTRDDFFETTYEFTAVDGSHLVNK